MTGVWSGFAEFETCAHAILRWWMCLNLAFLQAKSGWRLSWCPIKRLPDASIVRDCRRSGLGKHSWSKMVDYTSMSDTRSHMMLESSLFTFDSFPRINSKTCVCLIMITCAQCFLLVITFMFSMSVIIGYHRVPPQIRAFSSWSPACTHIDICRIWVGEQCFLLDLASRVPPALALGATRFLGKFLPKTHISGGIVKEFGWIPHHYSPPPVPRSPRFGWCRKHCGSCSSRYRAILTYPSTILYACIDVTPKSRRAGTCLGVAIWPRPKSNMKHLKLYAIED